MTIEIKRIRESMPNGSTVTTGRKQGVVYLECKTPKRVSDPDFEMIKNWQREIIGRENIMEFYTFEEGTYWLIYLKQLNAPIEIIMN